MFDPLDDSRFEPDHDVFEITTVDLTCPDCGELFTGVLGEHGPRDCPECSVRVVYGAPDPDYDELPF